MEKTAIPHKIQISNGKTSIVTNQIPDDSKGLTHIPNRSANVLGSHGTTYIAGNGIVAEKENAHESIHPLLEIGETVFKHYIIKQQITKGVGAEAQIYLAEYNKAKYIVKAYTYDKKFNERIYDTLKKLGHVNIARLYEYGYHNNKTAVEVTEYFENGSLEGKKVSLNELRHIVSQINEGLKALHDKYIYINDLKPQNIVIDSSGRVAIIDFSLASIESTNYTVRNGKELRQGCGTQTMKNLIGSPGYSSPEYYLSGISSRAGDYYSLGVTMFELLFGYPPFRNIATLGEWNNLLINRVNIFPPYTTNDLEILRHLITYDPHDRCTYNEIKKYTNGESITFTSNSQSHISFIYTIEGDTATDRHSLRDLLVKHWREGLDRFSHNDIYNSFVKIGGNQDIAALAKRITNAYSNRRREEIELGYLEFLYKLYPEDKRFVWRGIVINNTEAVSNYILSSLRSGRKYDEITTLISLGVLSVYFRAIGMSEQAQSFMALESAYKKAVSYKAATPYSNFKNEAVNTESLKFAYGFVLSQNKKLMIRNKLYSEKDIAANIGSFVNDLTNNDGYPTSEYGGLLIAEGKITVNKK